MSYVMDNLGTLGNGYSNEYEIKEFSIPIGGIPALGLEDVLYFDANDEVARSTTLYYQMVKST